jgi:hypothetical protein
MAWVALDRAVKGVERFGLDGDLARWRALRDAIHAEVCEKGYNPGRGTFVQYYGATDPDASLLMMPLVGFLPPSDPRVRGTVAAVERELMRDGFVLRYLTQPDVDGLPPGEGAFLACIFWLADNLALLGRAVDARATFHRLLGLANDVGLLSEQYDPVARRLMGNFPQAFTHVSLINTACNLIGAPGSRRPPFRALSRVVQTTQPRDPAARRGAGAFTPRPSTGSTPGSSDSARPHASGTRPRCDSLARKTVNPTTPASVHRLSLPFSRSRYLGTTRRSSDDHAPVWLRQMR